MNLSAVPSAGGPWVFKFADRQGTFCPPGHGVRPDHHPVPTERSAHRKARQAGPKVLSLRTCVACNKLSKLDHSHDPPPEKHSAMMGNQPSSLPAEPFQTVFLHALRSLFSVTLLSLPHNSPYRSRFVDCAKRNLSKGWDGISLLCRLRSVRICHRHASALRFTAKKGR